jgi:hypothetical protein
LRVLAALDCRRQVSSPRRGRLVVR